MSKITKRSSTHNKEMKEEVDEAIRDLGKIDGNICNVDEINDNQNEQRDEIVKKKNDMQLQEFDDIDAMIENAED